MPTTTLTRLVATLLTLVLVSSSLLPTVYATPATPTSAPATPAAPTACSGCDIDLENLDVVPSNDRMVFGRIGTLSKSKPYGQHDRGTLRIHNRGSSALTITALDVAGPWSITTQIALPATIAGGSYLDVELLLVAEEQAPTVRQRYEGTLTISSDDPDEAQKVVELGGWWTNEKENNIEPSVQEVIDVFGYTTDTAYYGQNINNQGIVRSSGDEVVSAYWKRGDTGKPVTIRQLVALHGCCTQQASVLWTKKGLSPKTNAGRSEIFNHDQIDGQSFLPRLKTTLAPAYKEFTPSVSNFGFGVAYSEWSDWNYNDWTKDGGSTGCSASNPCGHHVRFWVVRDHNGNLVPNAYIMAMDYSGINYDYNDNMYLITNIKPETDAYNPSIPAPLPGNPALVLEFDQTVAGTLNDKDNEPIGFADTQRNKNDNRNAPIIQGAGDSYDKTAIDLQTGNSLLKMSSLAGTNAGSTNTLRNGVCTPFDGRGGRFSISTTIKGPLPNLTTPNQQGGLMFGPDQDNYVKLVVAARSGTTPAIVFGREFDRGYSTLATVGLNNPASINTLELVLFGDPLAGTVTAGYRIDGGALTPLNVTLPIGAPLGPRFFDGKAKGCLMLSHAGASQFSLSFDRFAIEADAGSFGTVRKRYNVGGPTYTDGVGNQWTSDAGLYTPSAPAEGGANVAIANTTNDTLYQTYRGQVGGTPARTITFNIPVTDPVVDVRLHFAELYWGVSSGSGPGQRLFSIAAEGETLIPGFDIYAAAGAGRSAVVVPLRGIAVNDGVLSLSFKVLVDNVSLAGIEVLQGSSAKTEAVGGLRIHTTAPTAVGRPTQFVALTDGGDAVSYVWNFGDGTTVTAGTVVEHTYTTAGDYTVSVTATNATNSASASAPLHVAGWGLQVNFQTPEAGVPFGYVRDYGQAYGLRTVTMQGGGSYSYGWVQPGTSTPRNLEGLGRKRISNNDQRLDTFMHMQFNNDASQSGSWELAVPNGVYQVTVAVGDPTTVDSVHRVNAEGTNIINNFVPSGGNGSSTHHSTATASVQVNDGRLTLDANGGNNTKIDYVIVEKTGGQPISGLSVVASNPTVLGTSTFFTTTVTTGSAISYVWNFGDGTGDQPGGATISHHYANIGNYPVTVTATNDAGSVSATTTAQVIDQAISGLSVSASNPTVLNTTTAFTATVSAGTGISYVWNFGDGTGDQPGGATTTHTYASIGNYPVTVTATNTANSATASTSAQVIDQAITGLQLNADDPTTLGTATLFTTSVSSGSNISYVWNFGDGTGDQPGGATTTHTYAAPGFYTATVTASNSGGSKTATTEVEVTTDEQPIANLTLSADDPTPLGDVTTLTVTRTGGTNVSLVWNFGDGSPIVPGGVVITHTYPAIGTYTARVTATNVLGSANSSTAVTIIDGRITGLTLDSNSPTVVNTPTTFYAKHTTGTNVGYQWDFGDGATATTSVPTTTHSYAATGIYTATVTASNAAGSATATTQVKVFASEQAISGLSVSVTSPQPTPPGETTSFTASIASGTNISYVWDFGDGTPPITNGPTISHTYAVAGTYTVTVTASNSLGSATATTSARVSGAGPTRLFLPLLLKAASN